MYVLYEVQEMISQRRQLGGGRTSTVKRWICMDTEQSKKYRVKLNLNKATKSQLIKTSLPQKWQEKLQVQGEKGIIEKNSPRKRGGKLVNINSSSI